MKNFPSDTTDFCIQLESELGEVKTVKEKLSSGVEPDIQQAGGSWFFQFKKFDSEFVPYVAFAIAVFISFIAAVTVVSHDVPLMLGGL